MWMTVDREEKRAADFRRNPIFTPAASNQKVVTQVTDLWCTTTQQSDRHDFAERNAEKLVVGAVAGNRSVGRGWPGDAFRFRPWFKMPCPDGADALACNPLRDPRNVVELLPKGPAHHALLPAAPGACSHSMRRSPGLLRPSSQPARPLAFLVVSSGSSVSLQLSANGPQAPSCCLHLQVPPSFGLTAPLVSCARFSS